MVKEMEKCCEIIYLPCIYYSSDVNYFMKSEWDIAPRFGSFGEFVFNQMFGFIRNLSLVMKKTYCNLRYTNLRCSL